MQHTYAIKCAAFMESDVNHMNTLQGLLLNVITATLLLNQRLNRVNVQNDKS